MRTGEFSRREGGGRLWLGAAVAVLAGLLAAPWVFRLLLRVGRAVGALEDWRDIEFERVATRCVLLAFLLWLAVSLRQLGWVSWAALGWGEARHGWRRLEYGVGAGVGSVVLVFGLGLLVGLYRLVPSPGSALGVFMTPLLGALLVGLLEETLFRGILFGALRRRTGFWPAALGSSAVFALVHFAKPDPPVDVVWGRWYSGFTLLPHLFGQLKWDYGFFPFILTLFLMGLVLCLGYERSSRLYYVAGLHAGWVWAMRAGDALCVPTAQPLARALAGTDLMAKSYLALTAMVLMLAFELAARRRRGAAA